MALDQPLEQRSGRGRPQGLGRPWVAGLAVTGMLAVALISPVVQARAKALGVLSEALDLQTWRPFAASVRMTPVAFDGVDGHLYAPRGRAPAILLVPGATRQGLDDPRAVRVAHAFARAGRRVFLPELALYERRFDEADLERITRAGRALARDADSMGDVVVTGFSYGGSFALVAAADPRLAEVLAGVAVFGAYGDLLGVVQAAATGVSLVDGQRVPWAAHPRAVEFLHTYALDLVAAEDRDELAAALAGQTDPDRLDGAVRAVYDLITHDDPARTAELAAGLPDRARQRLRRFSPSSVADRITAPVVAMHALADPAVPYGEALRLERDVDGLRLFTVGLFDHVDPQRDGPAGIAAVAADVRRVWAFTAWVLEAQEPFALPLLSALGAAPPGRTRAAPCPSSRAAACTAGRGRQPAATGPPLRSGSS